jgi:anti-sigma factor RsiW
MTRWHASDDLVARYAHGSLPEPDAWSLEKHLEHCGGCAARVSRTVRETAAGAALTQVRTAVLNATPAQAPVPVPLAHARLWSSRIALPATGPRLVRVLWAAGPAVRGAWPAAVLLVAVGAVALAYGGGFDGARPLLLAVAPVVPVTGVALSYGAHSDPLHEIGAATASGGLKLMLTRTTAVLAVSIPLLTLPGCSCPPRVRPGRPPGCCLGSRWRSPRWP